MVPKKVLTAIEVDGRVCVCEWDWVVERLCSESLAGWWKPAAACLFSELTCCWWRRAQAGMWGTRLVLHLPRPQIEALFISVPLSICFWRSHALLETHQVHIRRFPPKSWTESLLQHRFLLFFFCSGVFPGADWPSTLSGCSSTAFARLILLMLGEFSVVTHMRSREGSTRW